MAPVLYWTKPTIMNKRPNRLARLRHFMISSGVVKIDYRGGYC